MPDNNSQLFDKYIVRSKAELTALHAEKRLEGAYMITGDSMHVGIHKFFYQGQRFKHWLGRGGGRTEEHADLAHNMICVGWDYDNQRPILAHMIKKQGWKFYDSRVKVNATCYFTYHDRDVDFINVYIPKDKTFMSEVLHNADQTAIISTEPSSTSAFSMSQLFWSQFKNPEHITAENAKRDIASEIADLILKGPQRDFANTKNQKLTCASYAMRIMQASELLASLDNMERQDYFSKYSKFDRDKLIEAILTDLGDPGTKLGAAFAQSRLSRFDPYVASSGDVAFILDKLSDNHSTLFSSLKSSGPRAIISSISCPNSSRKSDLTSPCIRI